MKHKVFIGVGVMPRTRYALDRFLEWYQKCEGT